MSCPPSWSYRPTAFVAGDQKCVAPVYVEHRGRTGLILDPDWESPDPLNGLFIRSRDFGYQTNEIEVEGTSTHFNVYFEGTLTEQYSLVTYPTTQQVRTALDNANSIVEMPLLGVDVADEDRESESASIFVFDSMRLMGGSGGPQDAHSLTAIRTGPERSICIIATTEDYSGEPVTPPPDRRVRQWNGYRWVTYSNYVAGVCPYEGTS